MPRTTRSYNLDLIRWMEGSHERTAVKMKDIANANYVSKMATGQRVISDYEAAAIEKAFGLPKFWLDRDNEKTLKMSSEDYEMLLLLAPYSSEAKTTFVQLLKLL